MRAIKVLLMLFLPILTASGQNPRDPDVSSAFFLVDVSPVPGVKVQLSCYSFNEAPRYERASVIWLREAFAKGIQRIQAANSSDVPVQEARGVLYPACALLLRKQINTEVKEQVRKKLVDLILNYGLPLDFGDDVHVVDVTKFLRYLRDHLKKEKMLTEELDNANKEVAERMPKGTRSNISANGVTLGWLYAYLDRETIRPEEPTVLRVKFLPGANSSLSSVKTDVEYLLQVNAPTHANLKFTGKPGQEKPQVIVDSVGHNASWDFDVGAQESFIGEAVVEPKALLCRRSCESNGPEKPEQVNFPADRKLKLVRTPTDYSSLMNFVWNPLSGILVGIVVGISVPAVIRYRDERRARQRARETNFE